MTDEGGPGTAEDRASSRQVAWSSAALAAGKLTSMLGGLVLAVLISRELGAAGLGVYSAAVVFYQVLRSAGEGGARTWLAREAATNRDATGRAVVHLALMALARALIVMPVALVAVPFLGFSDDLTVAVQVVVLGFLAGVMTPIQEAVFYAYHRTQYILVGELALALATVACSVSLLVLGYGTTELLIVFVGLRYLLVALYFAIIDRAIVRLRARIDPRYAWGLVREIRSFAASSFLSAAFSRSEMLILSLVGTDAQIGYYSAGLKMVEPWTMVPQTVMPNVLPVLSRSYHDRDGRAHRIQRLTVKYLQAIAIPVSVLLVVLADPLITTLFGQAFAEAVPIVQILAATVALQFYVAVLWRVLVARGDETVMLRAQAITVVPRVAGGLLLVLWLSSAGAALAALGALTLHAALLAHGVRADGSRLGVVALTWRFLAAAVLAGLLLLPLLAADLPLVVLLAAAAALYAAGVVLLRALDRDDLELVRRVLPSRPPRSRGALS